MDVFKTNFNNHIATLRNAIKTATEPQRTILIMQLENAYKAFRV